MNAGMHIHHKAVEMGAAFLVQPHIGKEQIHPQGLAAPHIAPDVEALCNPGRRMPPKKRKWRFLKEPKTALLPQGSRQGMQPEHGRFLGRIGAQLAFADGGRVSGEQHQALPSSASAKASKRRASSACRPSIMRPSKAMAPLPGLRANACRMRRAWAISSSDGANARLQGAI